MKCFTFDHTESRCGAEALNSGGTVALTSLTVSVDSDNWRQFSACRDTDPDLFFPVGTTGPAIDQIEAAKAVCCQCEVQPACLEFALATNQESGVWGGTSEEERRKLRKAWLQQQRLARTAELTA